MIPAPIPNNKQLLICSVSTVLRLFVDLLFNSLNMVYFTSLNVLTIAALKVLSAKSAMSDIWGHSETISIVDFFFFFVCVTHFYFFVSLLIFVVVKNWTLKIIFCSSYKFRFPLPQRL